MLLFMIEIRRNGLDLMITKLLRNLNRLYKKRVTEIPRQRPVLMVLFM